MDYIIILAILLLSVGIGGLVKKKIKISKRRIISGTPVVGLSIFYIIMAGLVFIPGNLLPQAIILGVVTLSVIIFAKSEFSNTI